MSKSDNIVSLPEAKEIEAQAAAWLMRFEDGDATSEDYAAFHAWRGASEQNANAFGRLSALWGALDIVEELKDYAAADDNIALINKERLAGMFSRRSLMAAAAGLAIFVGAGAVYEVILAPSAAPKTYRTAIGEQKVITLADGSAIDLNTDSTVVVSYEANARNVELQRGEAYFTVAPNPKKPFTVYAGKGAVTAVGTAFSVRLRGALIDVLVAKGRVALSSGAALLKAGDAARRPLQPAAKPLLELTKGQNATFEDKIESVAQVAPAVLDRRLSWRDGVLEFSGESLGDVVADVSRYTNTTIEIDDESLRDLPVSGYLKVGQVDAMVEALSVMADVKTERLSPTRVRLSRKE